MRIALVLVLLIAGQAIAQPYPSRAVRVVVPLSPGGVLFLSGLLHHGTPPNRSASRRRALQFHYVSVNCRKMDGPQHAQIFKEDAGYAGCATYAHKIPGLPIAKKT